MKYSQRMPRQHQEQTETVPVLTIKAAMSCFLNMTHKKCVWVISERLWLYTLLVGLVATCLFCAAGWWVGGA